MGHGGIRAVAAAAGVSEATVSKGVAELEAGSAPSGRVRQPGGGCKRLAELDPALLPALLALVEPDVRGDPMSPQYAAVGAASRASLGAAVGLLDRAAARGLDVADLQAAQTKRLADAKAFTAAYGRYCWPTDGLDGVRLAPFQILAAEGSVHAVRDHGWHLARLDRLCVADPQFFHRTDRRVVELDNEDQVAEATAWWERMTADGGEGMVVKPFKALVHDGRRTVQPGVKCRGAEYCGSSTDPNTSSRATWPGCASASSDASSPSPCAITPSGSKPWNGSSPANRSTGCTRACSPSSRWNQNPSTPDCSQ